MSTESVMPSHHLILCRPLLLLPTIPPSIRVFSNESALPIRWPKYQSFSFGISPSNEYSELISFRTDWFDLLAVHGTLKCKWRYFILFCVSVVLHSIYVPSTDEGNRVFFSFDVWVLVATREKVIECCVSLLDPATSSQFLLPESSVLLWS